jgi:hypothetical protein
MTRGRFRDLVLGAAGMLLVLVVAAAVLWWVVTEPVEGGDARPGSSPAADAGRPPDTEPPADLSEDAAWFAELDLDAGTLVTDGSLLRDVRATGQDVVTSPDAVHAERLTVEATVPFEVVANEMGEGTAVGAATGGEAVVMRTVEVLGRELRATATGTVDVQAGRLVVVPSSIDVGGPDFVSDAIADVVRQLVTIEHEVEGLPEGLVLHDVSVQGDGFRAYLSGDGVQLVP